MALSKIEPLLLSYLEWSASRLILGYVWESTACPAVSCEQRCFKAKYKKRCPAGGCLSRLDGRASLCRGRGPGFNSLH